MSDELRIDSAADDRGAAVVRVSGSIDLANVDRFMDAIGAADGKGPLVVDLTDVRYLDTSGVAALFRRAEQGDLELVIPEDCVVATLVELSHLGALATIRRR